MFDTTINEIRTGMPSRIDIHEHRAPTTDSARLLNELQHEAEKRIIATVPLEDNLIKGEVHLLQFVAMNAYTLRALYDINGKTFETQVDRSVYEIKTYDDQRDFLFELRDKMAKDIAGALIDENINPRIFMDNLNI